jgi:sugar/nucleoside kinase (ribokinase family)
LSTRHLDYLVIGHVTQDRVPGDRLTPGGTAAYAARTAQALGCQVGVITSAGETLSIAEILPNIKSLCVPTPTTTTFGNRYTPTGRAQTVQTVAAPLTSDVIPSMWRTASVVHLGPVARECDPALADLFPAAFLGLTPQGWMRRWDKRGQVHPAKWETADLLLPRASAVVMSEGDVESDGNLVARWAARTRVLAITRGPSGCTVYTKGMAWDLPAFPAMEVDPTGAGDIFAAAFFIRLWQGDDPRTAGRLANCIAAASVTRPGLSGTPTPDEAARCQALCA